MKKGRILEIFNKNKAVRGAVLGIITFTLVTGGVWIYRNIQKNKVLSESKDKNKSSVTDNSKEKEQNLKKEEKKDEPKNQIQNETISSSKKDKTQKEEIKKDEDKKEITKNSNNIVKKEKNISSTQKVSNNNSKQSSNINQEQNGLAGKIAKTNIAKQTNQIILVSGNNLSLWNKSNGKWHESLSTSARLGYGGLTSNKHEGDGATPTGAYPILYGFGFGSNPGTSLEYKRITNNSYFVDDVHSSHYNTWYEGKDQKGEHMIDHPQYKYGMVIGYNTSHTKGKGSAIFLHCNGAGSTAGCVSVSQSTMLRLLKSTHEGAYIIITSSNNNLKHF